MGDEIVVFVTTGSPDEAQSISGALVKRRLAACVNIVDAVQSVFNWHGQVCQEGETLMIIRSTKRHLDAIVALIKKLHSYEVPEIIALPIISGSHDYLEWIQQETSD